MRQNAALVASLATAVVLAGCGGGSGGDGGPAAAGATRAAHDGASAATAGPAGRHAHAAGHGRVGAPVMHRSPSRTGSSDGRAQTGSTQTRHADPRSAHDGGPAAADTVPLVDPGDYTYRAHGHAETALGDRDFDGKSRLTVTAPADNRRRATLRGEDGTTEQTLVGSNAGLLLADLKMSQQGFSSEFRPERPVLLMPAGAKVGDEWSWTMRSTDGDYTLHATLRLADDSGSATVGGRRVPTVTVRSTLVLDGKDVSMTMHQTDEAAAGGLVVHEHVVGDGTAYGTPVHTEADRRLTS